MSPTQRKGRLAELAVEMWLVETGWDVSRPTGSPHFDLIASKSGSGTKLVQVKSYPRGGCVQLRSTGPSGGQTGAYRHDYEDGDFDWLVVVEMADEERPMWLVPWDEIRGQASVRMQSKWMTQ